ncbi:MAG: hypothetical protein AB8H79_05930 [Myxococcota bacterium]
MPKSKKSAHKGTVAFHTQTDQRANKGVSNAFLQQKTGKGLAGGVSGAKDPAFEQKAGQFEMAFGAGAMGNGAVNGCVDSMMERIAAIVTAEWETTQQGKALDLEEQLGSLCGTRPDMKGVAGAVPKDKVYAHMLGGAGNVRTKMTALMNFGRPFQAKLEGLNKSGKTKQFIETLKANDTGEVKANTETLGARAKELGEGGGRLTPTPRDPAATKVAVQPSTRGEFTGGASTQSGRTAEKVGLLEDEADFQGLTKDDSQINGGWETKRVLWEEGARKWLINEENDWVASIRELSLPLKAGPSGTTDRLMQTRELLGVSTATDCRAACLAYLLPINAHSMVEIMEAANRFGAPYTAGPEMYHSVDPFGSLKAYAPDDTWWSVVEAAAAGGGPEAEVEDDVGADT